MQKGGDPLANSADLPGKTMILVVDDEKIIRLILCARLKREGYTPVSVASVDEAVHVLKTHPRAFSAIISDIMLGEMDGFVFRDIVRGMDPSLPFFFMTALDPEEGSGFLKSILKDPLSFYVPKSSGTDVLLKRVQRIVASRRVERFIERQVEESRQSLKLAVHIQRSILPVCCAMHDRAFYSVWWQPMDMAGMLADPATPRNAARARRLARGRRAKAPGGPRHRSRPMAAATPRAFATSAANASGRSCCGPSESAFFGQSCTSISRPSAPTATAASASGST